MRTIAVIDDGIHIGNLLEELLLGAGYDVPRAYSGTEAVLLLGGAVDYITKPFATDELLARIAVHLTCTGFAILKLLMQNPGQVIARSTLLGRI